jgi:GT2 family glycosyltransferase
VNRESLFTVAVPVHNAVAVTRRTVEYLLSSGTTPARIELWDDGSTDPRWEDLSEWTRSMGCAYHRDDENLGYTVNINRIFRTGDSTYVLLLNSDCLIGSDGIEALVRVAEQYPALAAIGPLSNNGGSQSVAIMAARSWSHLTSDEISAATTILEERLAWKFGSRPFVVPSVNGFCALWRRAAVEEVDFFDEDHFARGYGEEDDLCFRLLEAGWFCAVAPWIFAVHLKTQSFSLAEREARKADAMPSLQRLHGAAFVSSVVSHLRDHPLFRQLGTEAVDV